MPLGAGRTTEQSVSALRPERAGRIVVTAIVLAQCGLDSEHEERHRDEGLRDDD